MDFQVHAFNVQENLVNRRQPFFRLERPLAEAAGTERAGRRTDPPRTGTYWVSQAALAAGTSPRFTFVKQDDMVMIPMFPYQTPDNAGLAYVMAHTIQIGMLAVESLRRFTADKPLEGIIVISTELYDQRPASPSYLYSCGVAFRTQ